jgi:type I restriction enzyme S subunit
MEVKTGYKQTEVGVIPIQWEVHAAIDISTPVRGGSPRPAGDTRFFNGTFIPWLTVAALTNIPDSQIFVFETSSCLTEAGSFRSRTLFPGTLIIANSGATLGVAKLLGIKCCANDGIAALLNLSSDISSQYLVYYINTKTSFLRNVVASGNGQPNLNTGLIGKLKFPFPPTKAEQEAIAGALSDADALIESLEQLVAKKRQIKHGTMQQLLTGQKRLPGLTDKWEEQTLGDLGSTYGGLTGKTKADFGEGSSQYVTFMNVMTNSVIDCSTFERVRVSPHEVQNRVLKGDLLFNGSSETPEEVAMCAVVQSEIKDVYLNSFCFGFRFRDGVSVNGLFLAYYIRSKVGREIMKSLAQGSTRYNLSKTALLKAPFRLPELPEQTAIVSILKDMDAEIESLETKLAKAKQVKQGMMQELLTGRIRLT